MSIETRPVRVGTDIGGTFTDLEIFDTRTRRIASHKVPTTPEDPSIGLMTGLKEAGERFGFGLQDIGYLLHGTTIATNAVLQRKFPDGALVTTAGFEDVLEIGRHSRRDIYSVKPRPAPPPDCPQSPAWHRRAHRQQRRGRTRADRCIARCSWLLGLRRLTSRPSPCPCSMPMSIRHMSRQSPRGWRAIFRTCR